MKTAKELIEELEILMIQLVNHDRRHARMSAFRLMYVQTKIKIYQEILGVRNPVQLSTTMQGHELSARQCTTNRKDKNKNPNDETVTAAR